MHELIYPILQGYDSVMLRSDLTIVGTDQLFNEMMGRFFQEKFEQEPQVIITTKITPGLDGKCKQSKSLGNYVAIADSPRDKFGKIMSLPDNLIIQWMEVYTTILLDKIKEYKTKMSNKEINPRDVKLELAKAIVERYHGRKMAEREEKWFLETFSKREFPDNTPEIIIENQRITALELVSHCFPKKSKSETKRLIIYGALKVNGNKVDDPHQVINLDNGVNYVKIGKRNFFKIKLGV